MFRLEVNFCFWGVLVVLVMPNSSDPTGCPNLFDRHYLWISSHLERLQAWRHRN